MNIRNWSRRKSMLACAAVMALIMAVMALMIVEAETVYADDPSPENGSDVTLKPGDTFDCDGAHLKTTVYIKEPGDYTIKGKSESVRTMIESTDVRLFLADGLYLNCGITANFSQAASPINIGIENGEKDGEVRIISQKDADIYLEGYMAPAIRKEDTKTQLILETEDPKQPGTITAQGGVVSAGIGSGECYSGNRETTGNIVINSGNIVATGGRDDLGVGGGGAGIGGGYYGQVNGITINGGNIKACGSTEAAGIGGGCCGDAYNITINGGTVYADTDKEKAGSTAAIGTGGGDRDRRNVASDIVINGGNVTAVGNGAVCIGAGGYSDEAWAINIKITGGTVRTLPTKDTVCTGIGTSKNGALIGLTIEGGIISATGTKGAPAIGATGDRIYDERCMIVDISGGTLKASGGGTGSDDVPYDIGMDDAVPNCGIHITGGSIKADKIRNAKDENGDALHRVDIGFDGIATDGLAVTDAVFSDENVTYGTDQVCTASGGKVYFWLPDSDVQLQDLILDGIPYSGAIKCSDKSGTMKINDASNDDMPSYKITFRFKNNGAYIARLKVVDTYTRDEYYTDQCLVGQQAEVSFKTQVGPYSVHNHDATVQIWAFGWYDSGMVLGGLYFTDPVERAGYWITTRGDVFEYDYDCGWLTNHDIGDDELRSAVIKASPTKVKKGKKTTVKVTSDSGAKLTAKASNSKAKKAMKKKYVKIKAGKTAKITFTKKAPKGTYKFKVKSPANGSYKETVRIITIKVK